MRKLPPPRSNHPHCRYCMTEWMSRHVVTACLLVCGRMRRHDRTRWQSLVPLLVRPLSSRLPQYSGMSTSVRCTADSTWGTVSIETSVVDFATARQSESWEHCHSMQHCGPVRAFSERNRRPRRRLVTVSQTRPHSRLHRPHVALIRASAITDSTNMAQSGSRH